MHIIFALLAEIGLILYLGVLVVGTSIVLWRMIRNSPYNQRRELKRYLKSELHARSVAQSIAQSATNWLKHELVSADRAVVDPSGFTKALKKHTFIEYLSFPEEGLTVCLSVKNCSSFVTIASKQPDDPFVDLVMASLIKHHRLNVVKKVG